MTTGEGKKGKSNTPALDSFGRDLTELAREGKLDPVIGRQTEIERVIQILCRRHRHPASLVLHAIGIPLLVGVPIVALVQLSGRMRRGTSSTTPASQSSNDRR